MKPTKTYVLTLPSGMTLVGKSTSDSITGAARTLARKYGQPWHNAYIHVRRENDRCLIHHKTTGEFLGTIRDV
jgi:hypothetical protein